eukprot:scaffold12254_cov28-Attheya_sp.AAC.2
MKEWEDPNLSSTMYVQVQPTRTSAPRGKVFSSSLRKMLGDLAYPQIPQTRLFQLFIRPWTLLIKYSWRWYTVTLSS